MATTYSDASVDWNELQAVLASYAAATGLCVSAYDGAGRRRVGPLSSSKVASVLRENGALHAGGEGARIEQDLARRCAESGQLEHVELAGGLTLFMLPVKFGRVVACTLAFGWAFRQFATSMACQAIGKQLGVDGVRLWAEARLESPVSSQRMDVLADLLRMMAGSFVRQTTAVAELVELSRLREVLLASVSHELRTPLQVLNTRLEVLLRVPPASPEALRDAVLKMQAHVATEARLVEDLIESSRTRTGQLHIALRPCSLTDVLDASILSVAPNAEAKGIDLRADVSALEARVELLADPVRLQQVFWNLMSNAVKFTPVGGAIRVRASATPDACEVTISDNGRGIDPDMLPRVFEPFFKGAAGNDHGLGLGLSIARHIVDAHGGTISVESTPGEGTSFRVTLPVRRPAPDVA